MSDQQQTPQQVEEQNIEQTQPVDTTEEDTAWIEPYYKMDKDELLNNVDPVTLNQIRNTIGDQQFIDQWKLSEADYNRVIEGQEDEDTEEEDEPQAEARTIPTSTVYTSQIQPSGTVRRVYHSGYPYGSRYYGSYGHSYYPGSYYGSHSYYPSTYHGHYGHHGHSYYPGSHYSSYPYQSSYYGSYPYSGVTRTEIRPDGTRVVYGGSLRRSVHRVEEPITTTTTTEEPTRTSVTRVVDQPLRASYTRISTDQPLRASYTRISTDQPLRTSIVRHQAPVTRVYAGDSTLRTSYVGAPVTRVVEGDTLRTSYVGAPLRRSYVRAAPTLRNSSYVVGGQYPVTRTSVLRTSGVYRPTTYYPATSRTIPANYTTSTIVQPEQTENQQEQEQQQ